MTNRLVLLCEFYLIFPLILVEAEDTSSDDDQNVFVSVHPMLLVENEVNFIAVSPGLSSNFQHNADNLKLESNINGDKGMLQMS